LVYRTREVKSRTGLTKAAFCREKNLFTRKFDFNLRKKLAKCYLWSRHYMALKFGHFGK
jgi:hypothetical protein